MAVTSQFRSERLALRISLVGTMVMAGSDLVVGSLVNSNAILLDGVFSLLSMGMTGLSLYTAFLISKPDDECFQFGYAHLEPLINVVNGVFILSACLFAFVQGLRTLLTGGREIALEFALVYTIFTTLFCFGIFFIERHIARVANSEIVRVDTQEWLVDGILSGTILVGFSVALILSLRGYAHLGPYVDPVLVTGMSLAASILPFKVLRRNFAEVLLVAPEDTYQDAVEALVKELCRKYKFQDYTCHLAKTGREYDLEINFLIGDEEKWPTRRQDRIRKIIWDKTRKLGMKTWLTVSFTMDKRWL
ncbi:cation diffusion facilitator family transporter [Alkalispirochaeta sphaeroplastigenens]|uniref:Cation diffusion facilitator family transporter n=1 Tax=Alkalispirochaeta sphaeroplastigenens TaxID=1187066 RepID=A0A2S4K144_9SPIO|nr:cation transporter [Alkalispirochaeta sphaeroplastigenens]POR05490.1 cation diffusion facilitator family transporter [Alkalispirochaeta sphaeroplastigenens]